MDFGLRWSGGIFGGKGKVRLSELFQYIPDSAPVNILCYICLFFSCSFFEASHISVSAEILRLKNKMSAFFI
jgi:hypothetical protein